MTIPLTVHNAQVSTAQITVKTLTIGRKQVTMAVFRQLQRASLINENGDFRGTPWGTVNYHPYCGSTDQFGDRPIYETQHLHVVWQLGDELRQAVVKKPVEPTFKEASFKPGYWIRGQGLLISDDDRALIMDVWTQWAFRWIQLTELPQLFIAV